MLTLVNTDRIFSEDIQMNFGFDKCACSASGRATETDDVELPEGTIEALPLSSSYKYLGVLEASDFQHKEVKSNNHCYLQTAFEGHLAI